MIVHTGDGKGKTTAALGLALRAWSRGWSIGVVQFMKSGRWRPGEQAALAALGRVHEQSGEGGPVAWYQAGTGWTWSRSSTGEHADEAVAAAREGWAVAAELLQREVHDLLILDEITYPLRREWLDTHEVVSAVIERPGHQHVVMTGRGAPSEILRIADLVTDMTKVRHPYDAGIRGQRGIEW